MVLMHHSCISLKLSFWYRALAKNHQQSGLTHLEKMHHLVEGLPKQQQFITECNPNSYFICLTMLRQGHSSYYDWCNVCAVVTRLKCVLCMLKVCSGLMWLGSQPYIKWEIMLYTTPLFNICSNICPDL